MNKVYLSSQTATGVYQHELIKMTRLVRPCQVFPRILTGISPADESEVAERGKCRVVRSVLKFRYGYSTPLRTLDFLIMAHQQEVGQSRMK